MALDITLPKRRNINNRRTWHGMAFIMEALVLMVFLVVSIAILMQLFSASRVHNQEAYALSYSVILASNEAEQFNVDPTAETEEYYTVVDGEIIESDETNIDAFKVIRTVEAQREQSGTLYYANIKVEQHNQIVYEINSARYVGKAG